MGVWNFLSHGPHVVRSALLSKISPRISFSSSHNGFGFMTYFGFRFLYLICPSLLNYSFSPFWMIFQDIFYILYRVPLLEYCQFICVAYFLSVLLQEMFHYISYVLNSPFVWYFQRMNMPEYTHFRDLYFPFITLFQQSKFSSIQAPNHVQEVSFI